MDQSDFPFKSISYWILIIALSTWVTVIHTSAANFHRHKQHRNERRDTLATSQDSTETPNHESSDGVTTATESAGGDDDKGVLVHMMIEMQKRTEAANGLIHTADEEEDVDFYFEDDIILTEEQAAEILEDMSRRHKRKLTAALSKRWTLPIPYMFDGTHSDEEIYKIRLALAYWEDRSCITFREDPTAQHKLLFVKGRGCWSYVGYTGQENQTISIGDGCQSNGTIAHEIGHAIGFWHEQSRPDRDQYVIILPENVSKGKLYNFDKRTWDEIVSLGVPYDPGSDMHYGSKFYAKDPNSTLTTVKPRDPLLARVIGQRQELSFYDVKLANKAYCDDFCLRQGAGPLDEPCQRDGYLDPANCNQCRCPDGFGGRYCQAVTPGINANCGGVYYAEFPGTISSPGYAMNYYEPGTKCSWHIKAPPGFRVYLEFVGSFGIAGHLDVCKDYVEVRYNTSLALTGARFCLDDPTRQPVVSESEEMLVLFRTFHESRVCDDVKYPWKCRMLFHGFSARYYTKSCGGCGDQDSLIQAPCLVHQPYQCQQHWTQKIQDDCSDAWWVKSDCKPKLVQRTRNATCYTYVKKCCPNYQLKGDQCIELSLNGKRPPPSNIENEILARDDFVYQTSSSPPAWSSWSDWGPCTQSCGGGMQARTRDCINPSICGHEGIQADHRPCNTNACEKICRSNEPGRCDFWIHCTRTVYKVCDRYCSPGFDLHMDHCVLSPYATV